MARTKTIVSVVSKLSDHPASRDAAVVVIHGLELGRKYDLVKPSVIIGRSNKADIHVDQEAVSRNHAKIIQRGADSVLVDLGSTNGTFVNDQTIKSETVLRTGDFVKIGRTVLKFLGGGNLEQAYHEEIYRLTTIDGLTQVHNRRYFEEALEREISRGSRYGRELSLAFMDIDRFKQVNDEYGHLAGDAVLKTLAALVKNNIRREDVFARFGGEEFALLLPEVDVRGAVLMAEKIRKLVQHEAFTFDGYSIPITVSVGVTSLGGTQRDASEMIRGADARMYEAKQTGRNRVSS